MSVSVSESVYPFLLCSNNNNNNVYNIMSRGGVDYSKWDKMDFSDDDDDDNDDDDAAAPDLCRVTRLDAPSRVTIQQGTVHVQQQQQQSIATAATHTALVASPAVTAFSSSTDTATTTATTVPVAWTAQGAAVELELQQQQLQLLYWTQDRYTVTLRFLLPAVAGTLSPPKSNHDRDHGNVSTPTNNSNNNKPRWNCTVTPLLPYEQRHAAVSTTLPHLIITCNDAVWFQDDLPHAVHADQNDGTNDNVSNDSKRNNNAGGKGAVDWEIESYRQTRYLTATLGKATPVPDVTIQWRRACTKCPEIALLKSPSAASFATAWEKAHQQFQQQQHCGRDSSSNHEE